MFENERADAKRVVNEFLEQAALKEGNLVVIGCSTSEIASKHIGSYSNAELGEAVFTAMHEELCAHGLYGYEVVNVMPMPKAGGSFATAAWKHMKEPLAVEHVQAHAGIDIGDTLIGMHLKAVAVPVRIAHPAIGGAHIVCARTRAKYIGGERAHYSEEMM